MPPEIADPPGEEEQKRLADEAKKEKRRAADQKRREKWKHLAETTTDRRGFSVPIFAIRNGISVRQAWKEIAAKRLIALRAAKKRTIITVEAEQTWQRSLAEVIPKNPESKNSKGANSRPGRRSRTLVAPHETASERR